jgi:hypothetical protein
MLIRIRTHDDWSHSRTSLKRQRYGDILGTFDGVLEGQSMAHSALMQIGVNIVLHKQMP